MLNQIHALHWGMSAPIFVQNLPNNLGLCYYCGCKLKNNSNKKQGIEEYSDWLSLVKRTRNKCVHKQVTFLKETKKLLRVTFSRGIRGTYSQKCISLNSHWWLIFGYALECMSLYNNGPPSWISPTRMAWNIMRNWHIKKQDHWFPCCKW